MVKPRSYREAGVDVGLAGDFVRAIQPLAYLTRRKGLVRGIGGFGGLFELPLTSSNGHHPILVASADGVGTKICLAERAGSYTSLGVDLVAMNVNDILCTGAEPIFFLDYIACGKLNAPVLLDLVRGMCRGCSEAHCVLLGGETAQMPLVYGYDQFDLAGFAVGIVDRKRLVTGETIRVGDKILGLASNGLHSNGFTLVQRVLSRTQLRQLAQELLKPTRIYVRPVLDLLKRKVPVRGIGHITGGSFREKIPRVLPQGTGAVLYKNAWKVPAIFRKIQAAGVSESQMYRTFNMGVGMVLILPPESVTRAQQMLRQHHLASWEIGEVVPGHREVVFR